MEVMKTSMQQVVPDVEIGVHCNGVMKHWSKEVENEYEDDAEKGQVILGTFNIFPARSLVARGVEFYLLLYMLLGVYRLVVMLSVL